MFNANTAAGFYKRANEEVQEGNYFIIDWVCANPMNPSRGVPIIVAGNISLEEAEKIIKGEIPVEDIRTAGRQRILCRAVKVATIKE